MESPSDTYMFPADSIFLHNCKAALTPFRGINFHLFNIFHPRGNEPGQTISYRRAYWMERYLLRVKYFGYAALYFRRTLAPDCVFLFRYCLNDQGRSILRTNQIKSIDFILMLSNVGASHILSIS